MNASSLLMGTTATSAMRRLVEELHDLEDRLRAGGGPSKVEKQHRDGKLTARERVAQLIDRGSLFLEIGLLIAHDKYEGQAPSAGVVTGVGRIEGRAAVIVANDATVKAGAWWPETITKILRAQEIAMRNRLPIVYLVDSAGVNLPFQDGIFPGQYGAARIFYYNSLMRRRLRVPQISAVMGTCIAGGAYLPALSDDHHHGRRHQLHGPRRSEPGERRGGAGDGRGDAGRRSHAHARERRRALPGQERRRLSASHTRAIPVACPRAPDKPNAHPPAKSAEGLYDVLPVDHRSPYDDGGSRRTNLRRR